MNTEPLKYESPDSWGQPFILTRAAWGKIIPTDANDAKKTCWYKWMLEENEENCTQCFDENYDKSEKCCCYTWAEYREKLLSELAARHTARIDYYTQHFK